MNEHHPLMAAFLAIPDADKAQAFVDFIAVVVISNENPSKFLSDLGGAIQDRIQRGTTAAQPPRRRRSA